MTNTFNPARLAEYEIQTLTERIAENEVVYGPGCRPELRERLAAAKERLAAITAHAAATALQRFEIHKVRVAEGGVVHVAFYPNEGPECGAKPADPTRSYVQYLGKTNAYSLAGPDTCARCRASVARWWRDV